MIFFNLSRNLNSSLIYFSLKIINMIDLLFFFVKLVQPFPFNKLQEVVFNFYWKLTFTDQLFYHCMIRFLNCLFHWFTEFYIYAKFGNIICWGMFEYFRILSFLLLFIIFFKNLLNFSYFIIIGVIDFLL